MSAWDKKLGYVVPSWNTVIEYETQRMLPPGVSAHFSRITHTEDSVPALEHMSEVFPEHIGLLGHAGVDAICYACTGASFLKGRQFDVDYIDRVAGERTVTSMAGSLVEAANHLGLSRLAVAAPYEPWLLDLLVLYLQQAGFTITRSVGLNQQANILHSPNKAIELAMSAWSPDADGLILSCGNFRTLEVVDEIEERIGGKPLLTSNQSALWNLLHRTQWYGAVPAPGKLMRTLARVPTAA